MTRWEEMVHKPKMPATEVTAFYYVNYSINVHVSCCYTSLDFKGRLYPAQLGERVKERRIEKI